MTQNSIYQLITKYTAHLDEVFKLASLTSDLEGDITLTKEGANANEIAFPQMTMDGLGEYNRHSGSGTDRMGYPQGGVNLYWETKRFNIDRGRQFQVDTMDDEESLGVAFGMLAGEFIRTKVVPEFDAFRFTNYSWRSRGYASGFLTTPDALLSALAKAKTDMDNAEVPQEGRILYITFELFNLTLTMDTIKSRQILNSFSKIVTVPQTRFYTSINLLDGVSPGEESGGFTLTQSSQRINFMIISKPSVLQYTKHKVANVFEPTVNQSADAWLFNYRAYGICDVYDNKETGIYTHSTGVPVYSE